MAQFERTKTGGYRTRVYLGRQQVGVDEDGKPIMKLIQKTITAPTQRELKKLKAQLEADQKDPKGVKTVRTAIQEYIDKKRRATEAKDRPISPATIVKYLNFQKSLETNAPDFYRKNIYDITQADREELVETLLTHYSRSTVCTTSSFVSGVLKANGVQSEYIVGADDKDRYIPDIDTIKRLIEDCRGLEIEPAILLAAFGPMRRGEIAALTWDDIDFNTNTVSVTKAQVEDEHGNYIIKSPKTRSSYRVITYPDWVLQRIREHQEICPFNIDGITKRFGYFLEKNKYRGFRFHDLRHFAASYLHEVGTPDLTIQRRGGWKTDTVLKKVYTHELNKDAHDLQAIEALNQLASK